MLRSLEIVIGLVLGCLGLAHGTDKLHFASADK